MPEPTIETPAGLPQAPPVEPLTFQPFADIDALLQSKAVSVNDVEFEAAPGAQKPPQEASKPADQSKTPPATPDATKTPPGAPKAAPKETPKPAESEPKPVEKEVAKMAPKELRQEYESLKAKHKALEEAHSKLNTEFTATKSKPIEQDERVKEIMAQVEAANKRATQLDEELKFAKYEVSQEYKERFEEPFVRAYQTGRNKVAALKIVDSEGNVRQSTPTDFDRLVSVSDDDEAANLAQELFDSKAPIAMYHRERVQELNQARVQAIQDYRKRGVERAKQQAETETANRTRLMQIYETSLNEGAEKFPQWFKPDETDQEASKLLDEGYKLVDSAFTEGMAVEDQVRLRAALRHRAAAFGRLVHMLKKRDGRISELEKQVNEFKSSVPGKGEAPSAQSQNPQTMGDEIDAAIESKAFAGAAG